MTRRGRIFGSVGAFAGIVSAGIDAAPAIVAIGGRVHAGVMPGVDGDRRTSLGWGRREAQAGEVELIDGDEVVDFAFIVGIVGPAGLERCSAVDAAAGAKEHQFSASFGSYRFVFK